MSTNNVFLLEFAYMGRLFFKKTSSNLEALDVISF